jgi:hypothetical protein
LDKCSCGYIFGKESKINQESGANLRFKNREEYEAWKARRIKENEEKKQNPSNDKFVIEYTSYNQYKNVEKEEVKKEIVQEHINNKALGSEHFDRASETTNSKPKLFFITIGSFLLLIILVCSYFIFKTDSPETIYKKNVKATVFITTYDLLGNPVAQGSGFILAEDGVVATNYHVIEDAASIEVETHDEAILKPEGVLYIDQDNDIALVKLKTKEEAELYRVKIGDPSKVEVGEKIYTIGNPEGFKDSFSEGVVSAIREVDGKKIIQFTAPVSHGSSGGAVLNKKGRVVGISSLIAREGQNLNFAYPIDLIRDVVKSRDIIYTFPNINAAWQLIDRSHENDPGSGDWENSMYCDPNSIVAISETRKGLWCKYAVNATFSFPCYGFDKKIQHSPIDYNFYEIDCNNNKIRLKVNFTIGQKVDCTTGQKNYLSVHSDFSEERKWIEYRDGTLLGKIANSFCASH